MAGREASDIRDKAREALKLHFADQREDALARAAELARAHPGSALALNLAGYLHRHAGFAAWDDRAAGDDEAASALESYSRHHRAALEAFSAAARLAPGCLLTALAHAETLADCHRYEDARVELFRVLSTARHADPALHNVVYDLHPIPSKKARRRDAVARANLAMKRFLDKINEVIIPREAVKLLDASNLGGSAATEARDRAKLLADTYPYSARAQVLRAYIDLTPVRTLDTAMEKKELLRRVLGTVCQAAGNFDCSLLIALFHAKILFFLDEFDAAERECRRALVISTPNDPNSDDIPPLAVLGDDFDARVSFVRKQLRVLLNQIMDVAAQFWSSMKTTQQGNRMISVNVDTLDEYHGDFFMQFDKKGISGQPVKEMESTSSSEQNLSVFNKNSADKELCTLSATVQAPIDMDNFSNLSEDTLLLILSRVNETKVLASMSILSRYLRNMWVKLSTLTLCPNNVRAALSAYETLRGSGILRLNVLTSDPKGAEADATASWLRFAESRVLDEIFFHNRCLVPEDELLREIVEEDMVDRGTFELPCITKTCSLTLKLGNLGLTFPGSGIFSGLTTLFLENFRFQGQVSINRTMFPRLLYLTMKRAHGMVALEVETDTLSQLELLDFQDFERLVVNAQALKFLTIQVCFLDATAPSANIAAESLQELRWQDVYDENTISLGSMSGLRLIAAPQISKDWHGQVRWDQICASFLRRFSAIEIIELQLTLEMEVEIPESPQPQFMEEIRIPSTEILRLSLCTDGHSFGESVMQLLSRCTGIKALFLTLDGNEGSCPQDCTCRRTSLRTQGFPMTYLQKKSYFFPVPVHTLCLSVLSSASLRRRGSRSLQRLPLGQGLTRERQQRAVNGEVHRIEEQGWEKHCRRWPSAAEAVVGRSARDSGQGQA
ncbi:hypothetical protein ZWY2020_009234 [Hordeum vulgare]|nr:hypothetical protein ZWY2020_009234 [Hordeum vulgare]